MYYTCQNVRTNLGQCLLHCTGWLLTHLNDANVSRFSLSPSIRANRSCCTVVVYYDPAASCRILQCGASYGNHRLVCWTTGLLALQVWKIFNCVSQYRSVLPDQACTACKHKKANKRKERCNIWEGSFFRLMLFLAVGDWRLVKRWAQGTHELIW